MAAPQVGRAPSRLELIKAGAEHTLGSRAAGRVEAFTDGGLFVRAGEVRRFLAWLVDFAVFVLAVGAGFVALVEAHRSSRIAAGTFALLLFALFVLVPLLYGLCYGNGRALGGVLTGTQLVRSANGGRIGLKAPWAMMVRTALLPLLIFLVVFAAFAGGGSGPGEFLPRTSIDRRGTRLLHGAGFRLISDQRLPY